MTDLGATRVVTLTHSKYVVVMRYRNNLTKPKVNGMRVNSKQVQGSTVLTPSQILHHANTHDQNYNSRIGQLQNLKATNEIIKTDPGIDQILEIDVSTDIYHKPVFKLLKSFKLQ